MSKPAFTRAEPDARRLSLIEATARVLARDGASGASVRAIAGEAGVSPGLVAHHFGGVDALVAATYGHVGERVSAALDAAVAAAGDDPRARLSAYVGASFTPPIADRALLATWTAFWGLVIARPQIAALHDEQYARYRAELEQLLAACGLAPAARRSAAIAVTALVDGLWLELCLSPAVLDSETARAIAEEQIAALLR
ncbi:TetR family transcriptional regulator C-terminal domain-containing protein [Sphingomonas sp. DG1-23]|uniref:TetR family transcriptional regulator C-terminal domain-containing protein n=1 Tax=Sphingomonas sp. DG1-23 TaxID=3068316 RepID=UPI002740300A|nr:TetR family transcriptional regulator C-terminal domain-containing protein [Sphingomonas sp. DG1-23]MDP5280817.1 TetR family transcriptional regulator C-terminal domain-containing protein [Sphingomonas sp. DG1-23]